MMLDTRRFFWLTMLVAGMVMLRVTQAADHPQDETPEAKAARNLWNDSTRGNNSEAIDSPAGRFASAEDWDTLSAKVLPPFFDANGATAVTALLREARCTVDISATTGQSPPVRGSLRYEWKDDDSNGLLTSNEVAVKIINGDSQSFEPYRKQFETQALCNTARVLLQSSVRTAKQDSGFLVTISPGPASDALESLGLTEMKCTVDQDLRLTGMTVKNAQGVESFGRFRYEKIAGRWFASQSTRRTAIPGSGMVQEKTDNVYTTVDGVPVHSRMTVETEILSPNGDATATMQQEFVFRDWHLVKRERPLAPPRAALPARTPVTTTPSPVPVRTESPKKDSGRREAIPRTMPAANELRVPAIEKHVSPEARYVVYKPKDWTVKDTAQQGYLVITVTAPKDEYVAQLACGLNSLGEGPAAIASAFIANARKSCPDYQVGKALTSKDGHTIVFDSLHTDPVRGRRECRHWASTAGESFTYARCESPAGRFEQSRRVLLTILMNIRIMRRTIPDAPKALPLSQYRLSDGSASFGLPQGWRIERDSGRGFFTAKDRSGLSSFAVDSIDIITPQLGVTVPGVPVLSYRSPHQALASLVEFEGLLRDVRFVEVIPRNDIAGTISQVYTVGPVQVEECISTYLRSGSRCKSYTFGISFGSRLGSNWKFNHMSVRAPETGFDVLVPTLAAMMRSYRIDDGFAMQYIAQGLARLRRMEQETAAIIAKNRQEISAMMQAAYDERQRSQDWIDYQRTNYIRGQTDWISSMEGGAVYHTDSWGTRNTFTGEQWDGSPFNYVNFEGGNPKYNEQMTPINDRRLFEQVFRGHR